MAVAFLTASKHTQCIHVLELRPPVVKIESLLLIYISLWIEMLHCLFAVWVEQSTLSRLSSAPLLSHTAASRALCVPYCVLVSKSHWFGGGNHIILFDGITHWAIISPPAINGQCTHLTRKIKEQDKKIPKQKYIGGRCNAHSLIEINNNKRKLKYTKMAGFNKWRWVLLSLCVTFRELLQISAQYTHLEQTWEWSY